MFSNFRNHLSRILEIPEDMVSVCSEHFSLKKFDKGDYLLRSGEICEQTFFVEKGLLRMYSIDEGGKEHIIQFAPENWLISDRSSQFFNEHSFYFIDCVEDSEVIVLEKEFFSVLIQNFPEVAAKNNRLLNNHIRNLQRRVNSLLAESAETRYLEFIENYPDVWQRVPQLMVASYLGITPESLSRVRRELTKKQK